MIGVLLLYTVNKKYESLRQEFNKAVVARGRELGAWLQGIDTPEARCHHTPEAVMSEIVVTRGLE